MSSRALRKVQKLKELELQGEEGSDSEDESHTRRTSTKGLSGFALLATQDDDDDGDNEASSNRNVKKSVDQSSEDDDEPSTNAQASSTPERLNKKKKKKRAKSRNQVSNVTQPSKDDADLDEIDAALKSLNTSTAGSGGLSDLTRLDPSRLDVCKQLSIDTRHLNVETEIKRLFGSAPKRVIAEDRLEQRRQHGQQNQTLGLAEAVSGKYAVTGPGLSAALRRKNIFLPGKESWPKSSGGSLSMEIVRQIDGDLVEYRIVHDDRYIRAQAEFVAAAQTYDPRSLIELVRRQPYHVATLLQVSEIAKHERDFTTSGDLLERALFAFGRSVHATFAQKLAEGKARLDFRRPENREFWLTAWGYIGNLKRRGTWRTAYEWARLLLSINPEGDPYRVCLDIDQLAILSRQADSFVKLAETEFFREEWKTLPNIQVSRSLALKQAGRDEESMASLKEAVQRFPWTLTRLYKELNIDNSPPSIWGHTAETQHEELYAELYATQAKDVWNPPEARAFLEGIVKPLKPGDRSTRETIDTPISIDEARHVILTDVPALIALVPQELTSKLESTSDPLPPEDSILSYEIKTVPNDANQLRNMSVQERWEQAPSRFIAEVRALQVVMTYMLPNIGEIMMRAPPPDSDEDLNAMFLSLIITMLPIDAASQMGGTDDDMVAAVRLFIEARGFIQAQPNRTLSRPGGPEIHVRDDGTLRIRALDDDNEHET